MRRLPAGMIMTLLALVPSARASAQLVDAYASSSQVTATRSTFFGFGAGVSSVWMPGEKLYLRARLGGDYQHEQHLGRVWSAVTYDVSVAPPMFGDSFMAYVGTGLSMNWSGGEASEWVGARHGASVFGGVNFEFGNSPLGAQIEERFGYISGTDHTLMTRVGLLLRL